MSSMLDPSVKSSTAREVMHKGKGCLAVIVAAAVLIVGGYLVWDKATGALESFGEVPDYPGPGKGRITVTISDGSSLDTIGSLLVANDVIKSHKAWDEAVDSEERATSVQAGSYLMKNQMKAIDALRLLINPGSSRVRNRFTIPEGLRLSRPGERAGQGDQDQEVVLPGGAEEAEAAGPAQVRQEPPRRLPVPRHLRADGRRQRDHRAAADGGAVRLGRRAGGVDEGGEDSSSAPRTRC